MGRSVPPSLGWGLWLALCALGKPLTLSGLLIPGMSTLYTQELCSMTGLALPGPAACSSWACPALYPRDTELGPWAGGGVGVGGRGLTVLCLCLPHPGGRFSHVVSSGSPGPPWKCRCPLTSERGLLRQEGKAMGQAHSGRPRQSWAGMPGLLTRHGWVLAWSGAGGSLSSLRAEGPHPPLMAALGDCRPAP